MRTTKVGLIHYEPGRALPGYTLFCGSAPAHAYLIDMHGRIVHRWQNKRGIQYANLLANGNLLCRATSSDNVQGQRGLNGQAPAVFELDWNGNVIWEFTDDWLHHDHQRLANGNTLLLQWRAMDEEFSSRVQGGYSSEKDSPQMLGDVILEVTSDGEIVREWKAWEHLDPEKDTICPLEHRMEWTHANSVSETPDGNWVVSFRRIDTVVIIDPNSGDIVWQGGPGIVSHQHDARILANGNLTLFDNGVHRKGNPEFSQAVEIDLETREIIWRYQSDPPFNFFSFMAGSTERLPGGTTLICQAQAGRFFEVTPSGETVWEYVNPFYAYNPRMGGRMNIVFKVHRYTIDHPALIERDLDPARFANFNRLYA